MNTSDLLRHLNFTVKNGDASNNMSEHAPALRLVVMHKSSLLSLSVKVKNWKNFWGRSI